MNRATNTAAKCIPRHLRGMELRERENSVCLAKVAFRDAPMPCSTSSLVGVVTIRSMCDGWRLALSINNRKARGKCTQIVVTLIPPFFAGRRFFDWGSSSSSRFRPCSFPSLGPPDTGGFDMVKKLSGSRGTFSFQETAPSRNTNLAWRYSVGGIFYRVFQ